GYENSTAQIYAEKYGYKFIALSPLSTDNLPVIPAENMTWNGVNPDINRDGNLDAKDASLLLVYAAEYGAGNVKSFAEFMDKNYS
ncbi:MAG: hypothetical protein IKI37_09305, partial [Oscillospiraceae bacterium]|nr:hypothetical protein [Oscillospiraceae bacterium]